MNSLSWMIYAAEVLGNLGTAATIGAVLGVIAMVGGCFAAGIASIHGDGTKILRIVVGKWWVPAVFAVVAVIAPSSNTIYMIAASEAGETIITNPEAREVFNDLTAIIKSKLKEQLPKP